FLLLADQAQVGLVDQGGGLERLPGGLLGHLVCGEFAQLVVDEEQELPGGVRVALLDGRQDAGDVAHGVGSPSGEGQLGSILPANLAVAIKRQAWIRASVCSTYAPRPRSLAR